MNKQDIIPSIALAVGLVVLLCILFVCTACKSTIPPLKESNTERVVTTIEHDTAVVFVPDSASIQALLECDSTNNVLLRRTDITAGARIQPLIHTDTVYKTKMMRLSVVCHEDSLKRVITYKDSIISTLTSVHEVQYVRRRNGYDKFVSCGFWILILLIGARIAIKIYLHK